MRRTVLASMTKFCPRCLVGRRSSSAASERTSAGPRSLGPAGGRSQPVGMGLSVGVAGRQRVTGSAVSVGSAGQAELAAQPGQAP